MAPFKEFRTTHVLWRAVLLFKISINLYLQIINGYIWKDCDKLNRKLEISTTSVTKSGNIAADPAIKQSGNIKMLKINTTTTISMAVGTDYLLCILGVAQRPGTDIIKYVINGRITIKATGEVSLMPTTAIGQGQYLHITETFM